MRRGIFAGLAALAVAGVIAAPVFTKSSTAAPAPKSIKFSTSIPEALKLAAKSKKPVFIDFGAEWCGPCKKMLNETYKDPTIVSRAEGFISVYIDIDKQPKVAEKYKVEAVPTVVFLDSTGKVVNQSIGFLNVQKFGKLMDESKAKATTKTK